MCTAIAYKSNRLYFGRTLDNDFSYNEEVTVTPRNYSFKFRNCRNLNNHYAIIGMAYVLNDYPLYYDAMNEAGLCMAGLNFVGNAKYNKLNDKKENIAQFELIPWVLGQSQSTEEAVMLLSNTNITDVSFNEKLPPAQLHWMISDKLQSITVESTKKGLKIYQNPVGVLTNNPEFESQLFILNNYIHLSPKEPQNTFSEQLNLKKYSRGMGAIGLPGDLSSQSRFIRASFIKMNSAVSENEEENISQFFHILSSVEQTKGCCILENGEYEKTIYSSCCCADTGLYYYTGYYNRQITAVNINKTNLNSYKLTRYPLIKNEQIKLQN